MASSSGSGLNLEKYLIPLEEINRATNNFSPEKYIGGGGFGKVYRGQLSKSWENKTVAIKRLEQGSYQGENEFRNELKLISRFQQKNIIAFVGYCDEGGEMIIVYEYAVNGSLDQQLEDPDKKRCITWIQRLKICVGAARGLDYLHSGLGEDNRVIHRDMKSANILLDENLVAKVCDFGLSKVGPRNQQHTEVYTKVAGTQFYLDPTYHESSILRKESDVYSFGVVLFEMLSGILVYRKQSFGNEKEPQSLINFVRRYYQNNSIETLIDADIKDQIMDSRSFEVFKEIAYKCISFNIQERPKMFVVTKKLEEALDIELQKNDAALVESVMEEMRFTDGKPVAAFTIYKCFLQQKYLEAQSPIRFDRLIQIFNSAIEVQNNHHMAYWLSNASTLLFLIQNDIKLDSSNSVGKIPPPASTSELCLSLFSEAEDEAKKRAMLFVHQLKEYVTKVCDIIFINLKKEVGSILTLCIRALRTGKLRGRSSYRQDIVDRLNTLLNIFKENFVPTLIAQKIFAQIFSYINAQLFNSLLQYRQCCSTANATELKDGLLDFGIWCHKAKKYAGLALYELQHIDQTTRFLVIPQKSAISYRHIRNLCPILNKPQLNQLCANVFDGYTRDIADELKHTVARLKREMEEEHNNASKDTLMLAESSRILFSIDDLSNSLQVEDFRNVKPDNIQLMKYGTFDFLYTYENFYEI